MHIYIYQYIYYTDTTSVYIIIYYIYALGPLGWWWRGSSDSGRFQPSHLEVVARRWWDVLCNVFARVQNHPSVSQSLPYKTLTNSIYIYIYHSLTRLPIFWLPRWSLRDSSCKDKTSASGDTSSGTNCNMSWQDWLYTAQQINIDICWCSQGRCHLCQRRAPSIGRVGIRNIYIYIHTYTYTWHSKYIYTCILYIIWTNTIYIYMDRANINIYIIYRYIIYRYIIYRSMVVLSMDSSSSVAYWLWPTLRHMHYVSGHTWSWIKLSRASVGPTRTKIQLRISTLHDIYIYSVYMLQQYTRCIADTHIYCIYIYNYNIYKYYNLYSADSARSQTLDATPKTTRARYKKGKHKEHCQLPGIYISIYIYIYTIYIPLLSLYLSLSLSLSICFFLSLPILSLCPWLQCHLTGQDSTW